MPKKQVTSSKIRQPTGHFSHATMIEARGRLLFISGLTSRRADGRIAGVGDIEVQTRQVCENLKAAVEEAGGTMDDICRVDVYVRNMEHFDQIHKVRREYFKAPAPASTMVEICKMTSPDYLIEINAIAVVPDKYGADTMRARFEANGDVIVVTGGANGIGCALARAAAQAGARVVACDVDTAALAR